MSKELIDLSSIIKAQQRLKKVSSNTPLQKNHSLSRRYDAHIYLKREDMQEVRSFKIRGAYNKIASLSKDELSNGVVCASAGNHAQGVASACAQLHVQGVIYMPATTPKQKVNKVKHFGGKYVKVILIGDTYDDAQHEAHRHSDETQAIFIHPFNDYTVMAGQGTIAAEILDEIHEPVDMLLVAVGGGGLLSGVGSYFKQVSPKTEIIAVEATGAPAFKRSLEANQLVTLEKIDSFVDGIAVKRIGDKTFPICQSLVKEVVLVPEGKICTTILDLYNDQAIVAEPAGAISVSALDLISDRIVGKNVVLILCGGNNDITRTAEIQERSLLHEGKKHYFIIRFPQRAGALKDFLAVLGPNDDITHFEYTKKRFRESGPALVGIELKNKSDYQPLIRRMEEANINYLPLNDDPMLFEMLI
jgi:threonine dehydratase